MKRTPFSALKFGFLPEIEWDGVRLAQSVAIYRLVAKEVGIAGKNNVEMAQCDGVVDFCSEMAEGKIRQKSSLFVNRKEKDIFSFCALCTIFP